MNDGSTDATAAEAKAAGAEVITLAKSAGKGMSLSVGWQHAFELGFSWVLNMDGDGQHSPGDIPAFLEKADHLKPALIVGNRMRNPYQMPWLRRAVNRWMSARLSKTAGFPLPDSQCGFRLMHLDSWKKMELRSHHFEIESEIGACGFF